MEEIIGIVIKGSSGFGAVFDSYKDKVAITPDSIRYEYLPAVESEKNQTRKWSYRTNSPKFRRLYAELAKKTPAIMNATDTDMCLDVGGIEFVVTYSDKREESILYWCTGSDFKDYFSVVRKMVPSCEKIPNVLRY